MNTKQANPNSSGTLLVVTEDNFDELVLRSDVPVVIDFWAPWCGSCLPLLPTMEQLAEDYAGRARIAKCNLDDEPGFRDRLGIRSIPMVFFFSGGERHSTLSAAHPRSRYASILDVLLDKVSSEQAERVMQESEFINCVMGKRDVATLEAILSERPELINLPIELSGVTRTPVKVALVMAKDNVDTLLAAGPNLDHIELAGLGRVDDLRAAITTRPSLINEPDASGCDALVMACMQNEPECVAELLQAGQGHERCSIESISRAFGSAMLSDKTEIMRMLLEHGADIEIATADGTIHGIACMGRVNSIRYLLGQGLDPDSLDAKGNSIIGSVREALEAKPELQEMLDLLETHQASTRQAAP